MDCVGCDKCRLWGKIQTTGIATALKVLFELDEKALESVITPNFLQSLTVKTFSPHTNANLLQRAEVVALLNTLHRFSESLEAVNKFRRMWADMGSSESEQLILEAEKAAIPLVCRTPGSALFFGCSTTFEPVQSSSKADCHFLPHMPKKHYGMRGKTVEPMRKRLK
ncbi:hypothetical protein HHX47_DHR3001017 [Lentinula edodes]|nr:hypothetical protein HHX47_DHR3001017 [Lentinula edodes]